MLALALIAIVYQRVAARPTSRPIFAGTVGEAGMLLMIIGMSLLYSYVMSYLHISQGAAAVRSWAMQSVALAAADCDSC